jgi:hypothetical protein
MRHATALLYHSSAVASRNIRFASCGTSGKLTLWTRYVSPLRGSILVYGWSTMIQAERSLVQILMRSLDFVTLPNTSSLTIGLNEPPTEMSMTNIPRGSKVHTRCERLITSPPSVSRLSRQCGILNISQPYRPPRPGVGIALLFTVDIQRHAPHLRLSLYLRK